MTLEQKVRTAMTIDERCRNDDNRLAMGVWWASNPEFFIEVDGVWYVKVNKILDGSLPSQSAIQRIRAHIQNDLNELLPTDPSIARFRKSKKKNRETFDETLKRLNS